MASGNRIEWLAILRGLNILLVVMCHINLIDMQTGLNNKFCTDMTYPFHPLRMPLFIFCSGGLLYLSRIKKSWKTKDLYKDKIRRIMVPFFFFCFVYYFFKLLVNQYVKTQVDFSLCNFIESFYLFNDHPTAPLWFLATLMTLMVMYPLFCFLCRETYRMVIFIIFCAAIYFVDFTPLCSDNIFYLFTLNHYLIYFFFGIFFFKFEMYKYMDNVAYFIIFIIAYALAYHYEVNLLSSILGILWMISLSMIIARFVPHLFSEYREYIYQIYLMSIPFQAFVELILWKKLFYNENLFYIFYFLNLLVGLYMPLLISKIVERTNFNFIKMCLGLKLR